MSFFGAQLEEFAPTNSTIKDLRLQIEHMQRAILDLEHKLELLEKKIISKK